MKRFFNWIPLAIELYLVKLTIELSSYPNAVLNYDELVSLELRRHYLQTKIDKL